MKVILTFRWFCFEFKPAIQSCHEFLNCTSGRLLICGIFLSVWFYCFKYFHEFGWFSKYTAHRPQNLSRHSQCLNILYIRTFQFYRSCWMERGFFEAATNNICWQSFYRKERERETDIDKLIHKHSFHIISN